MNTPNQQRAALIEKLSADFYTSEREPGSSLPPWKDVEPAYQASIRRGISGMLVIAERAGMLTVNTTTTTGATT